MTGEPDVFHRLHLALARFCRIAADVDVTREWGEWSPCAPGVAGRWRACEFDLVRVTTPGEPSVVEHRPLRGLVLIECLLDDGTRRYLMNAEWLIAQEWTLVGDHRRDRDEMRRVALAVREATTRLVPAW